MALKDSLVCYSYGSDTRSRNLYQKLAPMHVTRIVRSVWGHDPLKVWFAEPQCIQTRANRLFDPDVNALDNFIWHNFARLRN